MLPAELVTRFGQPTLAKADHLCSSFFNLCHLQESLPHVTTDSLSFN
jgi:hypothetical protein